jgi:hypothetical protein
MTLCRQPPAHAGNSLADFSILKMKAIDSSETSVHTRTARRHIPENDILSSLRRETSNLTCAGPIQLKTGNSCQRLVKAPHIQFEANLSTGLGFDIRSQMDSQTGRCDPHYEDLFCFFQ